MEENSSQIRWMVEESARGSQTAFHALYDECQAQVFRFIRGRVGAREDALDILQDTFVELWTTLRKNKFTYTSDKEFHAFLYTIARRRISRAYRSRRATVSLEDVELNIGDEDTSIRDDDTVIVLDAVRKLNSSDRELVELHYFSGLKFSEIAALLGKGESAIRVRHHRALDKLKKILGYQNE